MWTDEQKEHIDKLVADARKADKEDKELADAMQRLVKNSDFQSYMLKVLLPRTESFGMTLLTPSGGMDGMVRSEFIKGALFGLCLARDMPSVIIQAMNEARSTQENQDASS